MQSIIRTLSPITFDAYIQDDTRKKVFTPGQVVSGVVRVKKDDVVHVKQAWIELVGEQMTQYGDKLFNPEFRPVQFMEKTFFNVHQDLPHSEGVKGDYAYYNFAVRIPDSDQFVPAGSTEVVEGKPLPPSLVVHPGKAKTALEPVAYNRYYVRVCIESQGQLARTYSRSLPFILLPLDTGSPVPAVSWGDTKEGERMLHAPSEWTRYRPKEIWKIGTGEKASGGFLKGLLKRRESDGPTVEVRVALSVPELRSWPRNQAIPFHLRITTTNTGFDLSTIAINFQLFQKIRVVAKGMFEDHDTVRHSSEAEGRKGRDGKH
ncbi:hypothetical protein NCC49_005738, partial [Naganishia albida]